MKRCTQCGRDNMDHENFCSSCGNSLNQAPIGKVCPNCQMPVAVDDRFCDNCGTSLPETSSGGFNPVPPNVPNSTRPMAGATPPPVFNQPIQTPVNQQPIMQQPVSQQPIGQQPPMMQPGGYQQYNQVPFPGTPMPAKKNNLALILSISVVLLLAIGGGVYFFFFNKDKEVIAPPPTNQTNTESNTGTNNQTPSTNQNNTKKNTEKPAPPPPKNNTGTNTDKVEPLGFIATSNGTINFPLQYYQALDFQGDGVMEFIVATSEDSSGHIDVLSFDMGNFSRASFFDVPGPIYELNASAVVGGVQRLFVPSSNNMTYSLLVEDGSYVYDEHDMGESVLSVVEGDFDNDKKTDLAFLIPNADGSYKINFEGSSATNIPPLVSPTIIYNMFLADIDGDKLDDLLYLAEDADGIMGVNIATWTGKQFELVGATTFGDLLINYFPGDADGDGVMEVITTNYTENYSAVEGRVWKWSNESLQFILVDIFTVDHPDMSFAVPIVGDFTGDGHVDIMMIVTKPDTETKDFIIYSR